MRMIDVHKRRIDTQKPSFYVLEGISSSIHGWSFARKMRRQYTGVAFARARKDQASVPVDVPFVANLVNPSTFPVSGDYINNVAVRILYDQVGGRDFIQTNFNFAPLVRASTVDVVVGGRVYAQFNGSNEYMTTDDSETPILDKDCTVFVVFESQASVNSGVFFEEIISDLDPTNHRVALVSNLNATGFTAANYAPTGTANTITFSSQQPTSTRRIYVFKKTGTLIELFDENGFIDDTTSALVFSVDTLLEIGRQLAGDIYFGGKFAEGIICNDSLDSTDYNKIMNNLKAFFL